eukprot:1185523-Prorocentrum_minimum.AAC.2
MVAEYQRRGCSRLPKARLRVFQAGSGTHNLSILGLLATPEYCDVRPQGVDSQPQGARVEPCLSLTVTSQRHHELRLGGVREGHRRLDDADRGQELRRLVAVDGPVVGRRGVHVRGAHSRHAQRRQRHRVKVALQGGPVT